jgi:methanogenic corrinoid protein MtbC1
MWQVGQLWSEGHMTVPAEHFASDFFRGLLTNLYHVATNTSSGPLILICCAPGESHELAALMLALLLRRKGMRIVYLGQSIEISGLIQVIQRLTPALICVSLTMPSYLTALIDLSRTIDELPPPRPLFAFGGQAFCHYTSMISQIPGNYLEGDIATILAQLQDMAVDPDAYNN